MSSGSSDSPSGSHGQWLIPLPEIVEAVSQVRGTLIVTSREQLKVAGWFDAYLAQLSPEVRAAFDNVIAASWLPVSLAHAHYAAIDRLKIDVAVVEQATAAVAVKVHGLFLSTVVRAAKGSGVTPLASIRILGRVWSRLFIGGALAVKHVGPKEVLVVFRSALLRHQYYRTGIRIHTTRTVELFCTRAYVREQSYRSATEELALRAQWV